MSMSAETIKNLLNKYGRNIVAKSLTRLFLWGATAISAKLAISRPTDDVLGQLADWGATIVLALIAAAIDYFHQKADRK
jgi:hypothetical protein